MSWQAVKDHIFFGVKVTASFRNSFFDLKSMDTAQLQRQMLIVKNVQVWKACKKLKAARQTENYVVNSLIFSAASLCLGETEAVMQH